MTNYMLTYLILFVIVLSCVFFGLVIYMFNKQEHKSYSDSSTDSNKILFEKAKEKQTQASKGLKYKNYIEIKDFMLYHEDWDADLCCGFRKVYLLKVSDNCYVKALTGLETLYEHSQYRVHRICDQHGVNQRPTVRYDLYNHSGKIGYVIDNFNTLEKEFKIINWLKELNQKALFYI